MSIDELIARLTEAKIKLSVKDGKLMVLAEEHKLDDDFLLSKIREKKTELISLLKSERSGIIWSGRSLTAIPLDCEVIRPEMLTLVELSENEISSLVERIEGGARNVQDIYPLAPLQEGVLFHHLLEGEGDPYLMSLLLEYDSRSRMDRYLEALQAVVARHDALRTSVHWEGVREPVQVVWRDAPLVIEEVGGFEDGADVADQLHRRFDPRHHRIDVQRAPLLRGHIAQDPASGRWLLMLLFHHLASDHVTLEVLQQEVVAHLRGEESQLPVPLPFRNVVAQARLGAGVEEQEGFFRRMLGEVAEPTAPLGMMEVRGDGIDADEARQMVESALSQRVRRQAREVGVNAASLFHLVWAQVVGQLSGREDVVFGTVLFGRMQGLTGAERIVGPMINTLPVRIGVGTQPVREGVRRVHALLGELMHYEHAPLVLAQRCSGVPAGMPLFTALLNYRHSAGSGTGEGGWEGTRILRSEERTNYPFTLSVDDLGEGFGLTVRTVGAIGAKRLCGYVHNVLQGLVDALESAPQQAIGAIGMLGPQEREQILREWNGTAEALPEQTLVELFEAQVQKAPEAVAVVYEGASLSYGELNGRSNRLARELRARGVGA
uniref:condensation domain-containing protein n=1 Tax=Trinickia mobilis TaxID=2816356 RepID=UPI002867BA6E